jgi:hypothetical protein
LVANFYDELERAVSPERLAPYRTPNGDRLRTAVNYFWNITLCQALYPALNMLEVAFRNSMHMFLCSHFNRSDWYDEPNFLQRREREDVAQAKRNIRRAHNPFTPGHVVAALNLGFWVSLLDSLYGEDPTGPQLWEPFPSPNLAFVFPYAPSSHQPYRRRLHGRLDDMRLLRNRISHYEPIWQGMRMPSRRKKTPLRLVPPGILHTELTETIGWINPTIQVAMASLDLYPLTDQRGQSIIEKHLRQQFRLTT